MDKDTLRRDFSDRLNELLDHYEFPAKHSGRQVALAGDMKVSQEAARRWLEGENIPRKTALLELTQKFPCRLDWLENGNGQMIDDPIIDRAMEIFRNATPEERVWLMDVLERLHLSKKP